MVGGVDLYIVLIAMVSRSQAYLAARRRDCRFS